jgi:hypothetical protein
MTRSAVFYAPASVRRASIAATIAATALPLALCLTFPSRAPAQVLGAAPPTQTGIDPYVSVQEEYDSNVHRLPNSTFAQQYYGGPRLGDSDTRLEAGANGAYNWDGQSLVGQIEARQFYYDHFTDLDHFEYLGNLQLNWVAIRDLDGTLLFHQERVAAPFTNNQSTSLELDTDRDIGGTAGYKITPDWRVDAGLTSHSYYAPLQLYPDYVEHETITHLGFTYLGIANLTFGASVDHTNGDFHDAPDVGPYSQYSGRLNANYAISGLTTLIGYVGYTDRNQANDGSVSTLTGSIGYTRMLTGKTSLIVQLTRAVDSYLAAGGTEVDSTASVGLNWSATYRLTVAASGGYTRSTFVGQNIPGSTATGRLDHSPQATLNASYQLLRHLQLKAFAQYQERSSNDEEFVYHDKTVGIEAIARWK